MADSTSAHGPRPPGSHDAGRPAGTLRAQRAKRRAPESPVKQLTGWLIKNQSGLAANLFALLFLAHSLFPRLRSHTTKFFTLSYYNPATQRYDLGRDDAYLVVFLIVLFTGLRAGSMEYVLAPYARRRGLRRTKAAVRFSEQAWLVAVYAVFLPAGVYLYARAPYCLSLQRLWTEWPGREMAGLRKAYILTQMAFWFQQIVVINIEDRRKDHWQMLTHHFITVSLIVGSYCYRLTPVAHVILVLMDVSDFFLPLAKCQKYLGYTNLCDFTFGAFMLGWLVCRQILFSMVCYSVWKDTPHIMPTGCFRRGDGAQPEPADAVSPLAPAVARLLPFAPPAACNRLAYLVEPLAHADGALCYNPTVKWSFLSLLLVLLLIICVWFAMVVQVAVRVLRGAGADDVRSDDDEEDEEEEDDDDASDEEYDDKKAQDEAGGDEMERGRSLKGKERAAYHHHLHRDAPPLEEEVGVDALDLKGWERRKAAAAAAAAAHGSAAGGSSSNSSGASVAVSSARRVAAASTGVSLPGHHSSDRKELLGRIGCEKQVD